MKNLLIISLVCLAYLLVGCIEANAEGLVAPSGQVEYKQVLDAVCYVVTASSALMSVLPVPARHLKLFNFARGVLKVMACNILNAKK